MELIGREWPPEERYCGSILRKGFHMSATASRTFSLRFPRNAAEEFVHCLLRAILAAEPDGPPSFQVAHHDAVGVSFRIEILSTP